MLFANVHIADVQLHIGLTFLSPATAPNILSQLHNYNPPAPVREFLLGLLPCVQTTICQSGQ